MNKHTFALPRLPAPACRQAGAGRRGRTLNSSSIACFQGPFAVSAASKQKRKFWNS